MTTLRKRIKTNFHGELFFSTSSQAKKQITLCHLHKNPERFMFSAHYMPLLKDATV